jgi:hypothetical protein
LGKLNLGILSGISGTVGTVNGSSNKKGDDIIRARSKRSRPANTAGQVNQQTRFGLVTGFMQGLNPFIRTGLKLVAAAEHMSPYNYACQYALNNAIVGTATQPEIDYSKIFISQGELSRISGATAVKNADMIDFTWSDVVDNCIGFATDTVTLVAYNVSNGERSYSMGEVARSEKTASLPIPYCEAGDTLLFYLFFQSATDPLLVSKSQHLGSVVVE